MLGWYTPRYPQASCLWIVEGADVAPIGVKGTFIPNGVTGGQAWKGWMPLGGIVPRRPFW